MFCLITTLGKQIQYSQTKKKYLQASAIIVNTACGNKHIRTHLHSMANKKLLTAYKYACA